MKSKTKKIGITLLLSALAAGGLSAASKKPKDSLVERGSYLVNNVGMCSDCHTPRTERGELVTERWLHGAPIGFSPAAPMPWAPTAPALAGLPSMTEAQAIAFLQTGLRPDGSLARPPMPQFRLSEADARAVVAYLKTLAK